MSGKITIVSKPPKLERKKRVAAYARVSSGKDAMRSIRSQHRSAITATSFKTTVTGSIRVYIPTKPRQAPRIQEQVFRIWSQTAVPVKLIW